jgi:hypothetical protein
MGMRIPPIVLALALFAPPATFAQGPDIQLTGVPDYQWAYGCFGTASGNLIGYWDRHGLPGLYTGTVNSGVAPLNSLGPNAHIFTLWATKAGYGGRATNDWGHVDNYYDSNTAPYTVGTAYEGTGDPYRTLNRPLHPDDCIADFMGMSHHAFTNLNGECHGNINAYAFNFFNRDGEPVRNATPPTKDIQSGLRHFMQHRGYDAELYSQVADTFSLTPAGRGFTYEDFMAEIDAGYPVLIQWQIPSYQRGNGLNPSFHAVLGYGYYIDETEQRYIYFRTSWAQGEKLGVWGSTLLSGFETRGYFRMRPKPKVTAITPQPNGDLAIHWEGPASHLHDINTGITTPVHWYVIEQAQPPPATGYIPVSPATTNRTALLPPLSGDEGAYRVRNLIRVRFQHAAIESAVSAQITNKFGPTNLWFDLDLEQVHTVNLASQNLTGLHGLAYMTSATQFLLQANALADLDELLDGAALGGLRPGTIVNVTGNPLIPFALTNQIPALQAAGVTIIGP